VDRFSVARAMKIAVIGPTGNIGSRVVNEALDRGHEVTGIVRDRDRELPEHEHLTRAVADATDPAALAAAVDGHDAVVSAVGGTASGNPGVLTPVARALIEALPRAGVKRLFVVGGAGSLMVDGGGTVIEQSWFPDAWKPSSQAQGDALAIYRGEAGDLDWTYLSPAHEIEPGERTGAYRTGLDALLTDDEGQSRISMEDYAVAVIDELERPQFVGRRFTIAY
jgi:hypothetical protein